MTPEGRREFGKRKSKTPVIIKGENTKNLDQKNKPTKPRKPNRNIYDMFRKWHEGKRK